MPIIKKVTISYMLMKINVDMTTMSTWCLFHRFIDGVQEGAKEMTITGEEMAGVLGTASVGGKPLADEITEAIYRLAVAKGFIDGEMS